jgi:hypothetical protein
MDAVALFLFLHVYLVDVSHGANLRQSGIKTHCVIMTAAQWLRPQYPWGMVTSGSRQKNTECFISKETRPGITS